jgi:hypothetical protein
VTAEEERWIAIVIEEGRKAEAADDSAKTGARAVKAVRSKQRAPQTSFTRQQPTSTIRQYSTAF